MIDERLQTQTPLLMASWSSKGRAFEYSCGFSIDEDIFPVYTSSGRPAGLLYLALEFRTNFVVKVLGEEEKRLLGSERFGSSCPSVDVLRKALTARLRDYWMSPLQIDELLEEAMVFAGLEWRPTVLDLEVCTVQEEGESLQAVLARAMRPDTLRPLDLTDPMIVNPNPKPEEIFEIVQDIWDPDVDIEAVFHNTDMAEFLGYTLYKEPCGVRVDDVDEGLAVMHQCGICEGKPFVGTIIAKLRCGHLFHYHCVVWPLKDHRACPICIHPPYDHGPVPNFRLPLPHP